MLILNKYRITLYSVSIILLFSSCEKFLEVELDKSLITEEVVFANDVTATSAVTGLYMNMISPAKIGAGEDGAVALNGLSSRDLTCYPKNNISRLEFENHSLQTTNTLLPPVWNEAYNYIYQANSILRGLSNSSGVSESLSRQLRGEALFIRAYCYFYLTNLFGGVPYVEGTDYEINRLLPRLTIDQVQTKILSDLNTAKSLLTNEYISSDRARPNRSTVIALLARLSLYIKDWRNAAAYATEIIDNPLYQLVKNPDSVFLKESSETIWHLANQSLTGITPEASNFILTWTPARFSLDSSLLNSFEINDRRKVSWLSSIVTDEGTFYFPYKYKILYRDPLIELNEYSVVFRLAEQFLIRAEARAELNDIQSARDDVNMIRGRAGLAESIAVDKSSILLAIEQERHVELFLEVGSHRWMDLKRTGRSLQVLGNGITQNDLLYPVPRVEFDKNPLLGDQNAGY